MFMKKYGNPYVMKTFKSRMKDESAEENVIQNSTGAFLR